MADEREPEGPEALTLPDAVDRAARLFGERSALEDGAVHLTFAALREHSLEVARAFLAAGLEPGDRAAIWAPNIHEWVLAAIGLQMAGGVLVPINTRFKGAEARYVLEKSGARLLFTVEELLGNRYVELLDAAGPWPASLERVVLLRGEPAPGDARQQSFARFVEGGAAVDEATAEARARAVKPDDPADILFTSGTTGQPKGVLCTHAQNQKVFWTWSGVVGLREGDRYLIINPFFHSFGYKAGWLACIQRGATILPHAVFDVPAVLERIGTDRVSVLPGPPTLYQSILAHPERERFDLSPLRLAVTGAATIPVSLIERMRDELAFETVVTAYGLTESCGVVTICRPDDDPETIATTSGRAIPGVEVRCVDDAGRDVPTGEPGEVVVRGYNVMRGYFDNPEATAEAIDSGGFLHTGDIGVLDARGYLRITDRKKDMFIVGGFNCYPAEVESLLSAHPDLAQVAVVGVPDERLGEVGAAFVVPKAGATVTKEAIVAHCRETMANYKVPRHVFVVDALPLNASGKVQKFVLRDRARGELGAQH